MDPNAALRDFRQHAAAARTVNNPLQSLAHAYEAIDAAEALLEWLAKGGFTPDWNTLR